MKLPALQSDKALAARPYDGYARPVAIGLFVSVALLGSLLLWAATSVLPAAAVTEGVVVVGGNRRPVQNRDGGIVSEVLVKEGAHVARGRPLVRLDRGETQAEVDVLSGQLDQVLAIQGRYRAEDADQDSIAFSDELTGRDRQAAAAGVMAQQSQLFTARRDAFLGNERILREQIAGQEKHGVNLQSRIAETSSQIASQQEGLDTFEKLLAKKLTEKSRVTAMQRDIATLVLNRSALEADLEQTRNVIASARLQIEQLAKARREEIATGLSVTGEQLAALRPKLRAARERMERTEILAPIDGYVLNLAIHGPGATLSAGQVAMEIVPDTDDLVLNVKIAPRDIEQLSEGQSAEVHFTINKARYQNAIGGELIRLSPDRKIDEVTRAAYYEAVVAINHDDLARAGVKLIPGMAATAAIVTGKRTVLEYFIDPILEVASLAMRES